MNDLELLTERFERHRGRLRAVAYRLLGSLSEADDAVQEAWLRLNRSDLRGVDNLESWLTTVVARISLDLLRSRRSRHEAWFDVHMPDPIVSHEDEVDPEHQALLVDSVGLAMLVVLDTLAPAERLAFVMHDVFAVPFDEIASMLGRSSSAARQLASRGRRRIRDAAAEPDTDLHRQRVVVDAYFAAARDGDFEALVKVLAPDVVLRSDGGLARPRASTRAVGPRAVADQAFQYARLSQFVVPARVNGAAGVIVAPRGRPYAVMGFTVREGRIVAIDALADPERIRRLDLAIILDRDRGRSPA
jgi:RNA polymerase sigma factor (sigma-70 family)